MTAPPATAAIFVALQDETVTLPNGAVLFYGLGMICLAGVAVALWWFCFRPTARELRKKGETDV